MPHRIDRLEAVISATAILMALLCAALAFTVTGCASHQRLAPREGPVIPLETPQATDQCEQPDPPDWCPVPADDSRRPA
jgi:hypothetical protein